MYASIINELKSNNSRLFKESVIEREMLNDNQILFEAFNYVYNKLITFGVKQVPIQDIECETTLTWDEFNSVLNNLINRKLTGNAARDTIDELKNKCSIDDWNNWYSAILIKDLKCGVNEKTINKIAKKTKKTNFRIPVFSCQLAEPSEDHLQKVKGLKIIQSKLDGVRVLTLVNPDGNVTQFTRNGNEVTNFPKIKEQFEKMANTLSEPMVFDGEVMSATFQDLMTQIHRKRDIQTDDCCLYLFDIVPLKDFKNEICTITQLQRSNKLFDWFYTVKEIAENIDVLGFELVDLDTINGKERFNEISIKAIDSGYEGIMLKDPEAPYECKRTTSWLKKKPVITVDLAISDFEEGTGKNVGRLGAFVCEGWYGKRYIKVNVGSGFSDEQRDEYWQNKSLLRDHLVEIKADKISQNQDGSYSLRFPRFVCFRDFEVGEKV